ncbi:MAG: phage tail protein [Gammaproteobacteria bacterium]|nr:phage tail protein [Gammaproteobacteria bacterium]
MPEYLAPGVFVEEVSFRSKSIEGVGTSVAAMVGPTRTGPLRGTPDVVTSFSEYQHIYGDLNNLQFGSDSVLNHTALAAKAFFDNGGKQLYVTRTVGRVNDSNQDGTNSSADFSSAADSNDHITFSSRFPGKANNYTLEFKWRDSENLLRYQTLVSLPEGDMALLEVSDVKKEDKGASTLDDALFPIKVTALVKRVGDNYEIQNTAHVTSKPGTNDESILDKATSEELTTLVVASIPDNARLTIVKTKTPVSGALSSNDSVVLNFSEETDLSRLTGMTHWGDATTLLGTIDTDGILSIEAALNKTVDATISLNLSILASASNTISTVMVQRSADIDILTNKNGETIYSYTDISLTHNSLRSLESVLSAAPDKRYDELTSPVKATFSDTLKAGGGLKISTLLYSMFDQAALSDTSFSGPRYLIPLTGGTDGEIPQTGDYSGEEDETKGSTGFFALENIEDISIVMVPAAAASDDITHQGAVSEMEKHCQKMRYRIGIVDSRESMSLSEVRDFRSNFSNDRLALYYPWVQIADPTGNKQTINVPPSGAMAGIYARTDVDRGVHKAPANTIVSGALKFAQDINKFQQELLNPNGINCLRSFPGRGHRVWGSRTLSSDPEWKYINVRRYFMFLERSIEKSTQWVVFEPNGEALWTNIRATIEGFLYNEWRSGHLLGAKPEDAFFVRCDRSTMTQNDLDNGRLVCQIGVAPLRPAEFVVFRIGQITSDANG